jgi:hypothetical protein
VAKRPAAGRIRPLSAQDLWRASGALERAWYRVDRTGRRDDPPSGAAQSVHVLRGPASCRPRSGRLGTRLWCCMTPRRQPGATHLGSSSHRATSYPTGSACASDSPISPIRAQARLGAPTASRPASASPASPTARPSPRRSKTATSTRSRRAARASTPRSSTSSNRSRPAPASSSNPRCSGTSATCVRTLAITCGPPRRQVHRLVGQHSKRVV